jgi:FMN-dependent NADH-azoreductase
MSLFRLNASILGPHSSSRALGDIVQRQWVDAHLSGKLVERDLGSNPIPATYWSAAVSAGRLSLEQWTDEQKAGRRLAEELVDELKGADAIIVATGLYNWGINQLVKSWIDLALVVAPLGEKILEGKPVVLVVTRGGYYGEDGPKAGWDHGTPWLVRIFAEVWGAKVTLVQRDFTLVGVNPALDNFKEQGAALKVRAIEEAERVGRVLAFHA